MRKKLLALLAVLFVAQGALQSGFLLNSWEKNYSGGQGAVTKDLDPSQLFLSLFGFREFLAGILWVRADSFFDSGNYDAILPIIRLVTILDPHQLDVYSTGMWHIAYNFTDEDQRSDRRYIPSAIALGKEGIRANPQTYECYFETGWIWYHKIDDDYFQAVKYFNDAVQHNDIIPARRNLLGSALQRDGKIDEAVNYYYSVLQRNEDTVKRDPSYGNMSMRDTVENNIDTMLVRMVQRGYQAQKGGYCNQGEYDTKPPFDVGFSVKATVVEARVIRLEGTWGVQPVGTRIRVVLRDLDYPGAKPAEMDWDAASGAGVNLDPPKDRTFMQEQLYVRNRRFNKKVDMSKDPNMYTFSADRYLLEFYYNPRSAPPHIQDKFGWSGEGMTDKHFLNTEVRPGQRVVYTSMILTRDQILRHGQWEDKAPMVKTANYVEANPNDKRDDLIMVPALRSGVSGAAK